MEKTFQILMKLGKLIPLMLAIIGAVTLLFKFWIGAIEIAIALFLFLSSIRNIPAQPPTVGLATVAGRRVPIVIPEGVHIVPWYLLVEFIPITVKKINLDFKYSNVRAVAEKGKLQAGGELELIVSITYAPDRTSGDQLIAYLNSGGEKGIENIIFDLLEEDIRHLAAQRTWEELAFGREELTKALIKKLTGEEVDPDTLEEMRKNGLPDVSDLGIKVYRLTIGRIKETGGLAKAVDEFVKEQQQRRGEEIELEFLTKAIQKLIEAGISPPEASDVLQAERGKAERKIYAIRWKS